MTLRRQLGVSSFGLNEIVFEPGQRGRIHRHREQEEVYLVLEGTLTLLIEGEEQVLERGELIRVGPELRRQLVNKGPDRLFVLALGGSGEHTGPRRPRLPRLGRAPRTTPARRRKRRSRPISSFSGPLVCCR